MSLSKTRPFILTAFDTTPVFHDRPIGVPDVGSSTIKPMNEEPDRLEQRRKIGLAQDPSAPVLPVAPKHGKSKIDTIRREVSAPNSVCPAWPLSEHPKALSYTRAISRLSL